MNIKTTIQANGERTAIDVDNYEAECDGVGWFSSCPMGWGKSEANAIADLLEQIKEKSEPEPTREPVGMAVASINRVLDDIVSMAANPATRDEVAAEEEALWRAKGHIEWILSGIKAKQEATSKFRIVK